MRRVTLQDLLTDSVCRKHLPRAGVDHSIRVAEIAVDLAVQMGVDPDKAAKAGLLHDIGHGDFTVNGSWDYELYSRGGIHPIKGAERAHELLVLKGEDPAVAREIAFAILFHSGSNAIRPVADRTPLQALVAMADDADEEELGQHHLRQIDWQDAIDRVRHLDRRVETLKLQQAQAAS
ncbi:MAG: HD domain-containing protein [Bacillota bacterium]